MSRGGGEGMVEVGRRDEAGNGGGFGVCAECEGSRGLVNEGLWIFVWRSGKGEGAGADVKLVLAGQLSRFGKRLARWCDWRSRKSG